MTVVGSLCSGYGGLDLGLALALGDVEVAWHVEYDPAPSKILDHRFPGVPNHGDVKMTDWTQVEPIDWLTAGYPCQPFSHAGKRAGADDPRHLWPGVAHAISVLRPRHCLLENVAGHLSLGFDTVLGDLAALGYDARWGVVRASDAGAPHGRARVFIVATDTCSDGRGWDQERNRSPFRPGLAAPQRNDLDRCPVPPTADTQGVGESRRRGLRDVGGAASGGSDQGLQRERYRDAPDDRGLAATDAHGIGHERLREARDGWPGPADHRDSDADPSAQRRRRTEGQQRGMGTAGLLPNTVADTDLTRPQGRESAQDLVLPAWGAYESAVRRWERVLGRPSPRPTEPGRNGERLSPAFVEWMMGLPAGWVTDVPGLARNAQLKALGNGVVPQQAALALRMLGVTRQAAA